MRYLLPVIFISILITSCKDNEEQTFVDTLVGDYNGTLKTLDCSLPQNELANASSTVAIAKVSETEIDFNINDTSGDIFSFSAVVLADSTISIPEFTNNGEMLRGSASKNSKLRIVLGNDCVIFGSEVPDYIFDEN